MDTHGQKHLGKRASLSLFWLAALTASAPAAALDDGWRVSVPLYLTAGSYFQSDGVSTDSYQGVVAAAEVVFSSPLRAYSAGFFAAHFFSADRSHDGTALAGGLFEHGIRNWDSSLYVVNYDAPDASPLWKFAGRVRYRVAARHKLGVEIVGPFGDRSAANVMLGYYGTISRSLSVKFVAGSKFKSGQNRSARTELVWQFN